MINQWNNHMIDLKNAQSEINYYKTHLKKYKAQPDIKFNSEKVKKDKLLLQQEKVELKMKENHEIERLKGRIEKLDDLLR